MFMYAFGGGPPPGFGGPFGGGGGPPRGFGGFPHPGSEQCDCRDCRAERNAFDRQEEARQVRITLQATHPCGLSSPPPGCCVRRLARLMLTSLTPHSALVRCIGRASRGGQARGRPEARVGRGEAEGRSRFGLCAAARAGGSQGGGGHQRRRHSHASTDRPESRAAAAARQQGLRGGQVRASGVAVQRGPQGDGSRERWQGAL